ncbi:hypothetical protein HK405_001104 [Cladochytrium tenue]|nr:hypothetical protein HK405_001104 [Cladochytrium tenue]
MSQDQPGVCQQQDERSLKEGGSARTAETQAADAAAAADEEFDEVRRLESRLLYTLQGARDRSSTQCLPYEGPEAPDENLPNGSVALEGTGELSPVRFCQSDGSAIAMEAQEPKGSVRGYGLA